VPRGRRPLLLTIHSSVRGAICIDEVPSILASSLTSDMLPVKHTYSNTEVPWRRQATRILLSSSSQLPTKALECEARKFKRCLAMSKSFQTFLCELVQSFRMPPDSLDVKNSVDYDDATFSFVFWSPISWPKARIVLNRFLLHLIS
jgi:hypothetical protein